MALYRNIQTSFWEDAKIVDDFTPEDKYFYLYLFTNPHTNLAGCYEVSVKQMANETGYGKETIEKLIDRFSKEHNVIRYSKETKEILLLNWHKYNWTTSEKIINAIQREIDSIKDINFQNFLTEILCGNDMVSIPYTYPTDTSVYTNTITNTNNNTDSNIIKKTKSKKEKYGEYNNVLLTDDEYNRLCEDYTQETTHKAIKFLDEYIEEKGYKSKSHNLAMRRWVFDAIGCVKGGTKLNNNQTLRQKNSNILDNIIATGEINNEFNRNGENN